jgi:hypothetical protein
MPRDVAGWLTNQAADTRDRSSIRAIPVTGSLWSVGAWAPNVTSLGWQVLAFVICVRL